MSHTSKPSKLSQTFKEKKTKKKTRIPSYVKGSADFILKTADSFIPFTPYSKLITARKLYLEIKNKRNEIKILNQYSKLFNKDNIDNLKLLLQIFEHKSENIFIKNIKLKLPNNKEIELTLQDLDIKTEFAKFLKLNNIYSIFKINTENLSASNQNIIYLILFLDKLFLELYKNENNENIILKKYNDFLKSEYNTNIFDIDFSTIDNDSYEKFLSLFQTNLLIKLYELCPSFQNIKRNLLGYKLPLYLYENNEDQTGGNILTNVKLLYLLKNNDLNNIKNEKILNLNNISTLLNYSSDNERGFYLSLIKNKIENLSFIKDNILKQNLKDHIANFNFRLNEKIKVESKNFINGLNVTNDSYNENKYKSLIYCEVLINNKGNEELYKFVSFNDNISMNIINIFNNIIKVLFDLSNNYENIIKELVKSKTIDKEMIDLYKNFFDLYNKIYNNKYIYEIKNEEDNIQINYFIGSYINLIENIINNENKLLPILNLALSKFICNNRLNEIFNPKLLLQNEGNN
jgi:hypothetical protein